MAWPRATIVLSLLIAVPLPGQSTQPAGLSPAERLQAFLAHDQAGRKAEEDGLPDKAAREYSQASKAMPLRTDIGLKAAGLWIQRKEYVEAARVLNGLKIDPDDTATADQVAQMLQSMAAPLSEAFAAETAAGWKLADAQSPRPDDLAHAAEHFSAAIDLRPLVKPDPDDPLTGRRSPYVGLAAVSAAQRNVQEAIRCLTRASKAGLVVDSAGYFKSPLWNPIRQDTLFIAFLTDAYGPHIAALAARPTESNQALDALMTAARQGDASALPRLQQAADAGSDEAMACIAVLEMRGWGVAQDYAAAMKSARQGAAAGNAQAMACIGTLYMSGWGVPQDDAEAMRWYHRAADAGNAGAMYNIALLYQNALGVDQDHAQARAWMQKAAAAGYYLAPKWLADNP